MQDGLKPGEGIPESQNPFCICSSYHKWIGDTVMKIKLKKNFFLYH